MRKLIYNVGLSADGFIAGKGGEFDWLFTDQDYGISEFLDEIDCTVMGRKSFDIVYEHDKEFFRDKSHTVFTSSQHPDMPSSVTFTNEEPAKIVRNLKERAGKSIWLVGGGELAGRLLEAGEIDEMLFSYHPIVLGKGIGVFGSAKSTSFFETVSVKSFNTGLVQVRMKKMIGQ